MTEKENNILQHVGTIDFIFRKPSQVVLSIMLRESIIAFRTGEVVGI